jgi:hypothetical protein
VKKSIFLKQLRKIKLPHPVTVIPVVFFVFICMAPFRSTTVSINEKTEKNLQALKLPA